MATPQQRIRNKHPQYVSEFEQFLNGFLDEHPEIVEDRRKGWNIFWDRKVDREELLKEKKDALPARAYQYF